MGSIDRRLERLEALYGAGEPDISPETLERAFGRVGPEKMDLVYDALVRGVLGDGELINLVDLPFELLTPEEVEALEYLREALEEEQTQEQKGGSRGWGT